MAQQLLIFTDKGLYCPAGDFYIDPWRKVQKAIITHAHSDHARPGHQHYLCHPVTARLIEKRLGNCSIQTLEYGQSIYFSGVRLSLHPAGHIPGSAQVRVEHKGEVWVFTGDFKTEDDGLSTPFELVPCHSFISECTFGLPIFNWEDQAVVAKNIQGWAKNNLDKGIHPVLLGYSLGKAQRIIKMISNMGYPVYTHGAVESMNEELRTCGINPGASRQFQSADYMPGKVPKGIFVAPPAASTEGWMKKAGPYATAFVSGWMAVRGIRRRGSNDRGFVLSDHADWKALNKTIKDTGAENIILTHGYAESFARYLCEKGYRASWAKTGYTGETPTGVDENEKNVFNEKEDN